MGKVVKVGKGWKRLEKVEKGCCALGGDSTFLKKVGKGWKGLAGSDRGLAGSDRGLARSDGGLAGSDRGLAGSHQLNL